MRFIDVLILASFPTLLALAAQNGPSKPKLSSEPLTVEQIAVYRAALMDYMKGHKGVLHVANKTYPLDLSRPFVDRACISDLGLESAEKSIPVVHRLASAVGPDPRIVLVGAYRQLKRIKEIRATAEHEGATDKQLIDSGRQAYKNGLFSLSEVLFDKQHRRAVVAYRFYCGPLCGHGYVQVLEKVGQEWVVSKTCGGWIS